MTDWRQLLSEHYDDPYHRGPCDAPTHAASSSCEESGCVIAYELCMDASGRVLQAWFEGEGCPSCEALASLLANYCENCTRDELHSLDFKNLGQRLGLGESQEWQRAACAELPWRALSKALKQPLDQLDGDLADGTSFGGPSLREEC